MIESKNIIQRLRDIVGDQYAVAFSDGETNAYENLLDEALRGSTAPFAVARPAAVEQIQKILTLAGESNVSVLNVSNATGNNSLSTTRDKPALLVDLSRMNKIIEVDTNSGYALIEPGVSFDQLHEYLTANKTGYWIDCDTNGAHSVCASITERSFGHTPYGDHLLMQCGMEVVLGDGEILRTGMGALPNSDTWQLFKYNYGPYLDGLFSQSELAVVTKVGLWLMPAPPAYRPFMVSLPDEAALSQALEVMRPLKIQMVVPNTVTVSHIHVDTRLLTDAGFSAQAQGLIDNETNFADWNLFGALYDLPQNIEITWPMVSKALRSIAGATVVSANDSPTHPVWPLRERLMGGQPAFSSAETGRRKALWFSVASPIEGEAALSMLAAVETIMGSVGTDVEQEFSLSWRTLFMRVSVAFSSENFSERRATMLALIENLDASGYSVSHSCRDLRNAVANAQTSESMIALQRKITAALDPAGTLS